MKQRTLVLTANDFSSSKYSAEPVLFLGEWCLRHSQRSLLENLDFGIVQYHWDDREKLFNDYKYLNCLYEELLLELRDQLNAIHQTEHSIKYWRIFVGVWLGYFLQVLFDRWWMLKVAINHRKCERIYFSERYDSLDVPNDMAQFSESIASDRWNEALYFQLVKKCWINNCEIIIGKERPSEVKLESNNMAPNNRVKGLFKLLLQGCNRLAGSKDSYFFINEYLPIFTNIKLQIKLGQIPKIWHRLAVPKSAKNESLRKKFDGGRDPNCQDFKDIARSLLWANLPKCYLEGYEELRAFSFSSFPKKPKLIFTSNSYWIDDVFKVWAAEKVSSGAKLVIGQHGGHFGTSPFSFNEEHQLKIADIWLSWGWTNKRHNNIVPIGNFKYKVKRLKHDPQGAGLLVGLSLPRYSYHLLAQPVSRQWLDHYEDQKKFLTSLPRHLRKQFRLKLHPQEYGWDQEERWREFDSEIQFAVKNIKLSQLINETRLCVTTYNSTGFLEALNWNIPTLAFWNSKHWELNNSAKPLFEKLVRAQILHSCPVSAAYHIAEIWGDVGAWWYSDNIQQVRAEFCKEYTAQLDNKAAALETLFKRLINVEDACGGNSPDLNLTHDQNSNDVR